MKTIHLLPFLFLLTCLPVHLPAQAGKKTDYYQITVYHFANAEQQQLIHDYLKNALLPALHQQQIKNIGAFTPIANDTAADKRIYVIMPLLFLQQAESMNDALQKNNSYLTNGATYLNAAYTTPPYNRMETILLKAFAMAPVMQLPKLKSGKTDHVYELRSYESATEALHRNKVKMFSEGGEIKLFIRLQFNAVFYSAVIAGSRMPNLMYMTSFENMDDRNAHWKTFSADAEWKTLSALPEYQHNVSRNETILMKATDYSDY